MRQEKLTPAKLSELDAKTIDGFTAWASDALSMVPMTDDAKVVVDALIAYSAELHRKQQELHMYWM